MKPKERAGETFQKLVELMDQLREECPWDKKQTIQSLQKYTIEEMYELVDAINDNNPHEIKEELGDILFHTIFYSRVASETDLFSITDVIQDVHEKLVRRHPHVFGDVKVQDDEDVKKNWEQLKLQEGKQSVLSGVPKSLPALIKAYRIQEKAKQVGFEWETKEDVWKKVKEEIEEFEEAIHSNDRSKIEEEFGDILFSLINFARFLYIDPEATLEKTNQKFISRFQYMERRVREENKSLTEYTLQELDRFWNESKTLKEKEDK